MWPFKKPDEVELTSAVYSAWLRAQRPPWQWFLRQPPMIQEGLALEGDDYLRQCISMGVEDGQAETEQDALQRLAVETHQRVMEGRNTTQNAPGASRPLTMGGLGKRQEERDKARQEETPEPRLFGRAPTGYEGTTPKEESPIGYDGNASNASPKASPGYDGMGGDPEPGDGITMDAKGPEPQAISPIATDGRGLPG